jgi:hypothetical protein
MSRLHLTILVTVALVLPTASAARAQEEGAVAMLTPASGETAGKLDPETHLAGWARTRQEFGFEVSPTVVRKLYERHGVSKQLGVPLSPEEERDLANRTAERKRLPAFEQALAAHQPEYAGVYTDQARGGIVVALVTEPLPEAVEAELREASGLRLEIRLVDYSQEELAAAREQVAGLLENDLGLQILALGTDVPGNRVRVGVRELNDDVRERFRQLYPDPIFELYETGGLLPADTFSDSPGPYKSGLGIVGPDGRGCSTGFMVATSRSATGVALLTAGHCIVLPAVNWNAWRHGGVVIGRTLSHGFVPDSRADAAEIEIPTGMASNLFWWNPDSITWLNGVEDKNADRVGDPVCKHGARTGLTCGPLQGLCEDQIRNGLQLRCLRRANMDVFDGDSGAGVWKQNVNIAAGIVQGFPTDPQGNPVRNVSYYSHVGHIQEMFGNRIISEWRAAPVKVRHSGQVIDVPGSRTDLVQLIQYPYFGTPNQLWYFVPVDGQFYALQNANSGWVVDVGGAGVQDTAPIVQWPWGGSHNQQFDLVRFGGSNDFDIRPRHSGKCVDVSGISHDPGAALHQWTCHRGNNQRWFLP